MDGEDLFIDNFFKNKTGLYVDVGAYHPLELSNTYLLYKRKWKGINIDINSLSIEYFDFLRPNDININLGVARKNSTKIIYFQKIYTIKIIFQGKLTQFLLSQMVNILRY